MKISRAVLFLAILAACSILRADENGSRSPRTIHVSGSADVYVVPDKVVLYLGIDTKDADINTAKKLNSEKVKKTTALLKELGIKEGDIQTDSLTIVPVERQRRYSKAQQLAQQANAPARDDEEEDEDELNKIIGYRVSIYLSVTLHDIDKTEDMITKLLQAGVNNLRDIDMQTSKLKQYREEARVMALKAAKEKAEKMAEVLGQSIGKPLSINESDGESRWPQYIVNTGRADNSGRDGSSDIPLGKITINASVSVTFEIE